MHLNVSSFIKVVDTIFEFIVNVVCEEGLFDYVQVHAEFDGIRVVN